MKYDLKMIYFTLNKTETKFGRVETVTNGLEIGFSSRISRRSREAATEPIEPQEPGAALQTCHMSQLEGDACAGVSGGGAGYSIARGLGPFAGDESFTGHRPAQLKEKCRWAGLGVSALDWACAFWAEATGPWEPSGTRQT